MSKAKIQGLQMRLDVLSAALVALARAVPAELAAAVQEGLRQEVTQRLKGAQLTPHADETIAADLGRLMDALKGRSA